LSLKYYKSHLKEQKESDDGPSDAERERIKYLKWNETKGEELKKIYEQMPGEGAYIFKPMHEGPNLEQYSYPYSTLMH